MRRLVNFRFVSDLVSDFVFFKSLKTPSWLPHTIYANAFSQIYSRIVTYYLRLHLHIG